MARPRSLEDDENRLLLHMEKRYEDDNVRILKGEQLQKALGLSQERLRQVVTYLEGQGLVWALRLSELFQKKRGTHYDLVNITAKGIEAARALSREQRNYWARLGRFFEQTRWGFAIRLMYGLLVGLGCVLGVIAYFRGCDGEPRARTEIDRERPKIAQQHAAQTEFGVIRIIDGDTFTVMYDGEETSVRIADIDAPEHKDPGGPEATAALKELIGGKVVRLEFAADRKRDHFGRLLAKVYVEGEDVAAEMVQRGCAVKRRIE